MRELREIRAAVVGTGFIGVVHVDALRRLGVQVAGVLGSSPERVAAKAPALGWPRAYADLDELLADDVDVVHLTTPNHLHHPQVRAVLAAGKHVVCEKPLAMTAAESGELYALAEASGLVHAVNFNIRFYPACRQARALVREGLVGDVHAVHGGYLQDWLLHPTDWNWRLDPALGGELRAVGDIGSHWLDLVSFVTGLRVEAVMADLFTAIPVRQRPGGPVETFSGTRRDEAPREAVDVRTEDAAHVLLRFEGGARGSMVVSQVSAGRKNRVHFQVDGARAALQWVGEEPERLWIGHRDRPNELLLRDPALLSEEVRGCTHLPGGHAEGFADTFRELYRVVYAAVARGGPPVEPDYPTFAAGHEENLLAEAIARSAREGRWVSVPREPAAARIPEPETTA